MTARVSLRARLVGAAAVLLMIGGASFSTAAGAQVAHPPNPEQVARGLREAEQSRSAPDLALPQGTIVVQVLDEKGQPRANAEVVLLRVFESIAQGRSEEKTYKKTGPSGEVVFSDLEASLHHNYAAGATFEGASYSVEPFRLAKTGHRVVLVTYPVTSDIQQAFVGIQALFSLTFSSGTFRVETLYRVMPLGKVTWKPENVSVNLPAGAKALDLSNAQGNAFLKDLGGRVGLQGSYPPGQTQLVYTYQLERKNAASQTISLSMPPHVTNMVVLVEKTPGLSISIPGFDSIEEAESPDGKRMFVGRRTMRPGQPPVAQLPVELTGLPVVGPGRWYAVGIALLLGALGLGYAASSSPTKPRVVERKRARKVLLSEMVVLEKARQAEEIGPRTYEQAKQEILLALSRLEPSADGRSRGASGES